MIRLFLLITRWLSTFASQILLQLWWHLQTNTFTVLYLKHRSHRSNMFWAVDDFHFPSTMKISKGPHLLCYVFLAIFFLLCFLLTLLFFLPLYILSSWFILKNMDKWSSVRNLNYSLKVPIVLLLANRISFMLVTTTLDTSVWLTSLGHLIYCLYTSTDLLFT